MIKNTGKAIQNSILETAKKSPLATAISNLSGKGKIFTYTELFHFSQNLSTLINKNSKVNERTVVITQRDSLGLAATVGVFLSETIYVPIDSQDPLERIEFILSDSQATSIICDEVTEKVLNKLEPKSLLGKKILNLNEILDELLVARPLENKEIQKTDSYMIYTSGTTGRPKGVLVSEGTLIPLLDWVNENTKAKETAKTLQFYSLGFDPSLLEIFSTLINGKELIVCDHDTKKDLSRLVHLIGQREIERLFLPISLVQLISEEFIDSAELLKSVTEINCGGDRMVITASIKELVSKINKLKSGETLDINNQYGPTEATIMVTHLNLSGDPAQWPMNPSIGHAVAESELLILNESGIEQTIGERGVLHIGGNLLAKEYWKNKDLTETSFIKHPKKLGERLYCTGDLASIDENGLVSFFGRVDHQIKINGLRVECSEVENLIKEDLNLRGESCDEAVVLLCERQIGNQVQKFLAAAIKTFNEIDKSKLKESLSKKLPLGMVPTYFYSVSELPLTSNGKIDRETLTTSIEKEVRVNEVDSNRNLAPINSNIVRCLVDVLEEVSGLQINPEISVFEQSLTSLQAIKFIHRANLKLKELGLRTKLNIAELYQSPSLNELERNILEGTKNKSSVRKSGRNLGDRKVAIVAMSCRFPKAESLEKFKELIENNESGISEFSLEEITHPSQNDIKHLSNFVPARGVLEGIDLFDPQYFGVPPRVAEVMDPQMRLFLEESLNALQSAQFIDTENTGVYCGMSNNTYIDQVEALNSIKCEQVGRWNLATLNEKDYIATQVAHKLNLKGPALSIHTACSTSLVAIIQGVRAIQNGECDSALCGGVHIDSRHKTGHLHQEGSIFSKDSSCRPYDSEAAGTIFSDGIGVIVLKELEAAKRDGNQILGLISGCGLNNDGGDKTSFTAPSVSGQRDTIIKAMLEAGISSDQLSFIEGHGTATPVGDPIEVQALVDAFDFIGEASTEIGLTSVKAQIGHTVAASGVAGVIKAVLCLNNEEVPSTAKFVKANPLLHLEDSPFVISRNKKKQEDKSKRFCGVSSFGVGGTNAHIVIEKFEKSIPREFEDKSNFILPFSASSAKRLRKLLGDYLVFLKANKEISLGSLSRALSLKEGQNYRKSFTVKNVNELIEAIENELSSNAEIKKIKSLDKIIFALPGQGAQYSQIGSDLYSEFEVFKDSVDKCCDIYNRNFNTDLKNVIFHNLSGLINFTQYTQPALFVYQYSMLCLLDSLGVKADLSLGHSVGEFALAAFNGVMSLEKAMKLIGKRGELMASLPAGKMLSVRESSEKVEKHIADFNKDSEAILAIATINSPSLCVVGGEIEIVDSFSDFLTANEIVSKELKTSHAFHTPMMNSILLDFEKELQKGESLQVEKRKQISTSDQELLLSDIKYWQNHITRAVNFERGAKKLTSLLDKDKTSLVLDIGPRLVVGQLLRQNIKEKSIEVIGLNKGNEKSESFDLMSSLGKAWESGCSINFSILYENYSWCPMPTVTLERRSYWAGYPLTKLNDIENKNNIKPKNKSNLKEESMQNFKTNLKLFVEDKSGYSDLCTDASFLELGLDSLLLTQLAIDIKNEFKVEVSFRDLMDSIDSIDKLAAHLVQENSSLLKVEEVVAKSETVLTETAQSQNFIQQPVMNQNVTTQQVSFSQPVVRQNVQMSSDLGNIIQTQMDLMRMQLEILAGGAVTTNQVQTAPQSTETQQQVKEVAAPVVNQKEVTVSKKVETTNDTEEETVKGTVNTSKVAFGAQARVNTVKEVSEEKIQESVEKVISAYCAKTPQSKAYTEKYRKVNADPRVVTGFRPEVKELTYPLVVNRSKDQRLWDLDGNEYVDVTCGFGSNFFGNQNERITKALHDQLDKGFEIGPQHELAGECAELLCELTGNERSAFCNTGSEAVLGALRISRTITGRQKVVMFKGSYHGINDEVIVRGRGDGKAMPAAAGINPTSTKDMILLEYGTEEALQFIRENANDLAAVIVEPVQSRRSDFQPKEFLKEVRKITESSGTAFIFDEVITGFRIALGGAQEYFGIRADLVTYGKIIGGGMPIGIVSGKSKFMDALDGGSWQFGDDSVPTTAITYFAGTFVRHPLALRALKEALLILKEGGKELYFSINKTAQQFVDQLNLFNEVFGAPIVVDNFGGVLKPRFTDTGKNNDLFFALMRLSGVHCYDGFPWFVTLGHQEGDLDFVLDAWKKCIIEMQSLGLFPKGLISPDAGLGENDFIIPPQSGSRLVKSEEGKPIWKSEKEKSDKII